MNNAVVERQNGMLGLVEGNPHPFSGQIPGRVGKLCHVYGRECRLDRDRRLSCLVVPTRRLLSSSHEKPRPIARPGRVIISPGWRFQLHRVPLPIPIMQRVAVALVKVVLVGPNK